MTDLQQLADQIARLQEALMFSDRKCDDLSVQVLRLNAAVERAERRLTELEATSRAIAAHGQRDDEPDRGSTGPLIGKNVATDESHKPPHY